MIYLDLIADLHMEDDNGHNWTSLSRAVDPRAVQPGAVLKAGRERFWSWVRILGVDEDGFVTFDQISGDEARGLKALATTG